MKHNPNEPQPTPDPVPPAPGTSNATAPTSPAAAAKPAPFKLDKGATVEVQDWSRDPHAPVVCTGVVDYIGRDGGLDVIVQPPAGIEPYVQTGLAKNEGGPFLPGQWREPQAS